MNLALPQISVVVFNQPSTTPALSRPFISFFVCFVHFRSDLQNPNHCSVDQNPRFSRRYTVAVRNSSSKTFTYRRRHATSGRDFGTFPMPFDAFDAIVLVGSLSPTDTPIV